MTLTVKLKTFKNLCTAKKISWKNRKSATYLFFV